MYFKFRKHRFEPLICGRRHIACAGHAGNVSGKDPPQWLRWTGVVWRHGSCMYYDLTSSDEFDFESLYNDMVLLLKVKQSVVEDVEIVALIDYRRISGGGSACKTRMLVNKGKDAAQSPLPRSQRWSRFRLESIVKFLCRPRVRLTVLHQAPFAWKPRGRISGLRLQRLVEQGRCCDMHNIVYSHRQNNDYFRRSDLDRIKVRKTSVSECRALSKPSKIEKHASSTRLPPVSLLPSQPPAISW